MFYYALMRLGGLIARWAPDALATFILDRCGDVAWWILPNKRAAAIINARRLLGPERAGEARRVARQTFRNYLRYIGDFMRFSSFRREELGDIIVSDHWDQLERAKAPGKGVLVIGLHIGSWDMAAVAAAQHMPFTVVADFVETAQVNEYVERTRNALGISILPISDAARGCLKALRAGEGLGLLIDRPSPDGVVVNFCGAPGGAPTGPAKLALKTGASVITGAVIRLGPKKFLAMIDPPQVFTPSDQPQDDVRRVTQAMLDALEVYARRFPEQLIMFRRFWIEDQLALPAGRTR